jgi:antitoxin component of MazEF toxin-antitoxin module
MKNFEPLRNRMKLVSGNDKNDAVRVSLPKDALAHLGWNRGDTIRVSVEGHKMVLVKA